MELLPLRTMATPGATSTLIPLALPSVVVPAGGSLWKTFRGGQEKTFGGFLFLKSLLGEIRMGRARCRASACVACVCVCPLSGACVMRESPDACKWPSDAPGCRARPQPPPTPYDCIGGGPIVPLRGILRPFWLSYARNVRKTGASALCALRAVRTRLQPAYARDEQRPRAPGERSVCTYIGTWQYS